MLAAPLREGTLAFRTQQLTRKNDTPARGPIDPRQNIEERRFAAPRRTSDGKERLSRDGESECIKNTCFERARVNHMRDIFHTNERRVTFAVFPVVRFLRCLHFLNLSRSGLR